MVQNVTSNIVTIYDIGAEDVADYIVMEFVDGVTLERLIPHGAHGSGQSALVPGWPDSGLRPLRKRP